MEVVLQGQDDQAVEAVQRMFSSAQDGLAIADPVDDDGLTVLHIASRRGLQKTVEELLQLGAPLGLRARGGETALLEACRSGKDAVASSLIKAGADVNLPDGQGQTPLHWATQLERSELSFLLMTKGASPSAQDLFLRTPLHWACQRGLTDVVKVAVHEHHADPSACTQSRETPMHWACLGGSSSVAALLRSLPTVDVGARNAAGETPADKAEDEALREQVRAWAAAQKVEQGERAGAAFGQCEAEQGARQSVLARQPRAAAPTKKMTIKLKPR
mmetsp:Transcript_31290/g.73756  ORF Transcript_31290/g.73756 Transcript_31290/m.73756 type:complete len:274 (+) Transcript_31290:251-1072(+)